MQLTADIGTGFHIEAYDQDSIQINKQAYSSSLVISPDRIIAPWNVSSYDSMQGSDLQIILDCQPELVIIGTGGQHHFAKPEILAFFAQHKIGIEIMTTAAACRTYNLCMNEGRRVVAGLIVTEGRTTSLA